jgi:endogenous inhibitor of DNA gyrase (YacG/DUF329 family)
LQFAFLNLQFAIPITMPLIRCPICLRTFESDQSPALPFCSERCRKIDLGRWLDEGYSVPVERERPEEAEGWDEEET